jgi:hypothetical protein
MEKMLQENQEETTHKEWIPEVIIGGKDGPPPENWLLNLDRDTIFAAREQNSKNPVVQEFQVDMKFKRVVKLTQFSPSGEDICIAVDSLIFSRMMNLIEVY